MKQHFARIRTMVTMRGPSHIREGYTMEEALDMLAKVEYIVTNDDETPPVANANVVFPTSFAANAAH